MSFNLSISPEVRNFIILNLVSITIFTCLRWVVMEEFHPPPNMNRTDSKFWVALHDSVMTQSTIGANTSTPLSIVATFVSTLQALTTLGGLALLVQWYIRKTSVRK